MVKSKTKSVIIDSIPNTQTEYVKFSNIVGQKYHIAPIIKADINKEAPKDPSVINRRIMRRNRELSMIDPQLITEMLSVIKGQ